MAGTGSDAGLPVRWAPPSPEVAELVRTVASRLLGALAEDIDALPMPVSGAPAVVQDDPALRDAWRESGRVNIAHWLGTVAADPTRPVPPARSPAGVRLAHDLVRRAQDPAIVPGFRAGEQVAWRAWMRECCTVAAGDDLAELLEYSSRLASSYVDAAIASVEALAAAERARSAAGGSEQRLTTVALLLGGAPVRAEAVERLGFDVTVAQTAAVLWSEGGRATEFGGVEQVVVELARTHGWRALVVAPTAETRWAWFADVAAVDVAHAADAMAAHRGVRLAIGTSQSGLAGFRRSHEEAQAAHRTALRLRRAPRALLYEDVEVLDLLHRSGPAADVFRCRTLGDLAEAPPVLRQTLRTHLQEQSSPSRTAARLYTHRNTVLKRLLRAEALLPGPLRGRELQVLLALELDHWDDGGSGGSR